MFWKLLPWSCRSHIKHIRTGWGDKQSQAWSEPWLRPFIESFSHSLIFVLNTCLSLGSGAYSLEYLPVLAQTSEAITCRARTWEWQQLILGRVHWSRPSWTKQYTFRLIEQSEWGTPGSMSSPYQHKHCKCHHLQLQDPWSWASAESQGSS